MRYRAIYLLFYFLLAVASHLTAGAQDTKLVNDSLYSGNLKEMRHIEVLFPEEYKQGSPEKYEVLYCLEGISDFVRLEYNMLKGEGFIPRLVLVGINDTWNNGVNNRDRDFTPTHVYGETGSADKMLQFVKNELLPYVEQHYPVQHTGNTLYGGSLSGLFAVYTFLKEPGLFTSFIAVDPSLWWDNFYPDQLAASVFARSAPLNNTLWLAGREGSAFQAMGIAGMDSLLANAAPVGLRWKRRLYDNETHFTTQFKGLWDGLKFSYSGFYASQGGYPTSREISIKPRRGLIIKDRPFLLTCFNLADSPYIRYTTDGTEPTEASPSFTGENTRISLDKTSVVRFKSFCIRPQYDKIDSAFFTLSPEFVPANLPKGFVAGGLSYRYYQGDWDTLPVLTNKIPQRSGKITGGNGLDIFSPAEGYALAMDGYIYIPQSGYYIFGLGGSHFRAWVGDQQVLGNHIGRFGESFMVPLQKGYYPLRIEYLHVKNGNTPAPLYLTAAGGDDFQVPPAMLYHRP
ncbi:MAG TPA: alpha/beta hydrolase-fold protein [Chitinophagaceae bacterium]|nr:alpha/beta hydrolase-fold protein [Chitinophagaceae bacterium]